MPNLKFGYLLICLTIPVLSTATLSAQEGLESEVDTGDNKASDKGPTSTDLNAAKIIQLHITANGGLENLNSIKTLKKTGSSKEGKELLQITEYYKAPNKYRIEKRFRQGGREHLSVLVTDGRTVWSRVVSPNKKPPVVLKGAEAKKVLAGADIHGNLVDWKSKGHNFSYQGKSKVTGRPAYLLKAGLSNGDVLWYYFDSKSFLITRIGFKESFSGTKIDADAYPVKFKKINGAWHNETIEFTASNQVYRTIAYDNIIANGEVSDDLFALPKIKQFTLRQKSK